MVHNLNIRILLSILLVMIFLWIGIEEGAHWFVKTRWEEKQTGITITSVATDLARYQPGHPVKLTFQLENKTDQLHRGEIKIQWKHVAEQVGNPESIPLSFEAKEKREVSYTWNPPKEDFTGYLAEISWVEDGRVLDETTTAVDVSSDWSKFPRYGYLSEFPDLTVNQMQQVIDRLNRYHINGLQFYDWQWKHNDALPFFNDSPITRWKNIANQDVLFETVKRYIQLAHDKNMMALNYNLLYGSYKDQEQNGIKKEWGIFQDPGHTVQDMHPLPETWASPILLLNPAHPEWRNHWIKNEQKAMDVLHFDGVHVDQLGDRGKRWDAEGKPITLDQTFGPFLQEAKQRLGKRLVMNAVDEYGQDSIATNPVVDFLYTEVWENKPNYGDLKKIIDRGQELTKGTKNMILAGYMNYRKADHPGTFNKPSILLTNAVIFAAGGAHIELGDTGMLSKEYFPNKSLTMTSVLEEELKSYYDFLVAYQNLLRDRVTETKLAVTSANKQLSNQPNPHSIWYFTKKKENRDIIHLINLVNRDHTDWRDNHGTVPHPEVQKNITLQIPVDRKITKVYLASPDQQNGKVQELSFTLRDKYIEVTVPALYYWDMIVME